MPKMDQEELDYLQSLVEEGVLSPQNLPKVIRILRWLKIENLDFHFTKKELEELEAGNGVIYHFYSFDKEKP
jgi:hypothetical protein